MLELIKAHPWMTFWIIIFGLMVIDNIAVALVNRIGQ